jgi:hypothetical protein
MLIFLVLIHLHGQKRLIKQSRKIVVNKLNLVDANLFFSIWGDDRTAEQFDLNEDGR